MPKQSEAAVRQHGGGTMSDGWNRARTHYSTTCVPVALQVHKRGRCSIVAKVITLNGAPVLAVAVRHQRGTAAVVSVPVLAVDYAERAGCRYFYWRHDRRNEMRRISLEALRAEGWLQGDGELYIPLDCMEQVPYAHWEYATNVVRLRPEPQAVQLGLLGGIQS